MTEEILQASIMKLRARATERFGIIKDLYHRPATTETTDQIVQHAVVLAQLEGAMVTLQQYSGALAKQTDNEALSNAPEEPPTQVEVEEEGEPLEAPDHEEVMKRSATYRKSQKSRENKSES